MIVEKGVARPTCRQSRRDRFFDSRRFTRTADIRCLGRLLVAEPDVQIGWLAEFWRIRSEVQPPAAYSQFRSSMAVCKTAPFALLLPGP
jgi:hypothetical protein